MYEIDRRSICTYRFCLGFLIIVDLINRARDLVVHYSDYGVLPRSALIEKFTTTSLSWSFHLLSGEWYFQAVLFFIAGVFALGLMIGYQTRLCAFASWLLLVSLHYRNHMVLNGGDVMLRMLVFWAIFMPSFSFLNDEKEKRSGFDQLRSDIWYIAMALQLVWLYWSSAVLKSEQFWVIDKSAIYYALHIDQFVTPLGIWLRQHLKLMEGFTVITYYLEEVGPFLLFVPFFGSFFRSFVCFAFIGFHLLGLALTMELGLFPWICSVAWLVFIPSWVWDHCLIPGYSKMNQVFNFGMILSTFRKVRERVLELFEIKYTGSFFQSKLAKETQVAVLLFFMVYVGLWNVRETNFARWEKYFPTSLNWIGRLFHIDQKWDMFAPNPLLDDGWYVIAGELMNGKKVDLIRGTIGDVSFEKPELVSATYKNQRWRKYMMNLWLQDNSGHRLYLSEYLTRKWNHNKAILDQLKKFTIYYMREDTPPPGEAFAPVEKIEVWNHYCIEQDIPKP